VPLLDHVARLKAMSGAASFSDTCRVYAELFMLSGKEDTFKEPPTAGPVNVVFSAAPLDRAKARRRAEAVKP
jgi:hypothetical protein